MSGLKDKSLLNPPRPKRQVGKPVRREEFLHRFGTDATLMIVEWAVAKDGTEQKSVRYEAWKGL
jgi:hypothetical protein